MKTSPRPILIGLAGPAGVGKDTAAHYLRDYHGFCHTALAEPIKKALEGMGFPRETFDKDGMKDQPIEGLGVSYRRMAQTLGTEWGRNLNPEFWLRLAQRKYDWLPATYKGLVVSDIRFPNEAAWIRREGALVHIAGPARRELAADGKGHASETGIDWKQGDLTVLNDREVEFMHGQLSNMLEFMTKVEG